MHTPDVAARAGAASIRPIPVVHRHRVFDDAEETRCWRRHDGIADRENFVTDRVHVVVGAIEIGGKVVEPRIQDA